MWCFLCYASDSCDYVCFTYRSSHGESYHDGTAVKRQKKVSVLTLCVASLQLAMIISLIPHLFATCMPDSIWCFLLLLLNVIIFPVPVSLCPHAIIYSNLLTTCDFLVCRVPVVWPDTMLYLRIMCVLLLRICCVVEYLIFILVENIYSINSTGDYCRGIIRDAGSVSSWFR